MIAAGEDDSEQIRVSADDLDAALAELLDTRNRMTRAVLGYRDEPPDAGPPASEPVTF